MIGYKYMYIYLIMYSKGNVWKYYQTSISEISYFVLHYKVDFKNLKECLKPIQNRLGMWKMKHKKYVYMGIVWLYVLLFLEYYKKNSVFKIYN